METPRGETPGYLSDCSAWVVCVFSHNFLTPAEIVDIGDNIKQI